MKLNLKKRFKNKAFCVSFIGTSILLIQQLGFGRYLPNNLMDIINSILTILALLGIMIDPTTNGISDSQMVLEEKTSDELKQELDELKQELDELKEKIGE